MRPRCVTGLTPRQFEMGVSRFGRCGMETGETRQERRTQQPWNFDTEIISNTEHPQMSQWHYSGQNEERNHRL